MHCEDGGERDGVPRSVRGGEGGRGKSGQFAVLLVGGSGLVLGRGVENESTHSS